MQDDPSAPPSYQAAEPPLYSPSYLDTGGADVQPRTASSFRIRAPTFPPSQHGFYITTPQEFKDFSVSDLARSNALFYFAHATKLLRGWDSTLHLGGRAGPLAFRVRKAAFKHDVEVAAESGEAVAALRMTDGGYEFIGSDRQSTFVWTPAPVTLLSSIWRCVNRKTGTVVAEWRPTEYSMDGALLIEDASAHDSDLLLATFLAVEQSRREAGRGKIGMSGLVVGPSMC